MTQKAYFLRTIVFFVTLMSVSVLKASSQGFSEHTLRYGALLVDKIAMRLTGLPAEPQTKQDFLEGKKTLEQIAEDWKSDPQKHQLMRERLTEFWTQTFSIFAPVDVFRISTKRTGESAARGIVDDIASSGSANKVTGNDATKGAASKRLYYRNMASLDCNTPSPTTGCRNAFCWPCADSPGGALAFGPVYVVERSVPGVSGAAVGESTEARRVQTCTTSSLIQVTPWWAPESTVSTCPDTTLTDFCGPGFEKCMPIDKSVNPSHDWRDPAYQWPEWVNIDFTREPGMMASRIVLEDRRWDDVLTSTEGVATGVMINYVKKFAGNNTISTRFSEAAPPQTYKKSDGTWTTLKGTSQTESNLIRDRNFYWIDRGNSHAGVITTPAWQMTFNGHRAKANAAMETFLCEKFSIPEGSKPIPSEETDLTKRPYCSLCHMTLEPLSGYFKRWPAVGNTNYLYTPSINADGNFRGTAGSDTNGLAGQLVSLPAFSHCAVNRAFEFLVGRSLNSQEVTYLMPQLLKTFDDNNRRLWPVMKQIISLPVFAGERN